jgi:hypothetical protein
VARPARELRKRERVGTVELLDEPPLLQSRTRSGEIEPVSQQQPLGFRDIEPQRLERIAAKLAQRSHPAVAVDQNKGRLGPDHQDRRLLPHLRDRSGHARLPRRVGDAKRLVA